jgi:hypothetical protein
MRPKTSVAAVIVAIFILAAATVPSASAGPPDDACSLLTQAQVTAALGVAVGAPHQSTAIMKTCTWIQADAGLIGGKSVQVILRTADDHDKNKAQMNQANAIAKEKKGGAEHAPTVAPIGGLGDDAYYTTTGRTATLSVKKGNVGFNVAVNASDFSLDKTKALEKTLAEQALSKL